MSEEWRGVSGDGCEKWMSVRNGCSIELGFGGRGFIVLLREEGISRIDNIMKTLQLRLLPLTLSSPSCTTGIRNRTPPQACMYCSSIHPVQQLCSAPVAQDTVPPHHTPWCHPRHT